jgi:hypothetical protein
MPEKKILQRNARALFYWVRDHLQARSPYATPDSALFRGICDPAVVSTWKNRGSFASNLSTVLRIADRTGLPAGSMFAILLTPEVDYASLSLSQYREQIEQGKVNSYRKGRPRGVQSSRAR